MEMNVCKTVFEGRPEDFEKRLPKEQRCYDLLDGLGVAYTRVDHDIADTIEPSLRKTVAADGTRRGIAFPTGLSLNHVAAHYTPNAGDTRVLQKGDVMKVDIGLQVNGWIIDSAFTMAFDPTFDPLLETVREATNAGVKAAGIDVRLCEIGEAVEEVMTFRPGVGLVRYAGRDISWCYRGSDIPPREIVLEATLRLRPGDEALVKRTMEGVLERRKETQPLEMLSCGSVFRNPPDDSAARLIESCGLKGFTVGRAQVSQRHANFIVNLGGATAAEVTKVIVHVLNKVREHHGIELRPEVKFLGFPA